MHKSICPARNARDFFQEIVMKNILLLLFIAFGATQVEAAVRNFNSRINASGISEEELANPVAALIQIHTATRNVSVVPIKIYFGLLPHQIRKQWLIELYDVKRDQRLVCPLTSVLFQEIITD